MACYLGDYPGAATNREAKLIRAVQSFLDQTYRDAELIICSDGCSITNTLFEKQLVKMSDKIHLVSIGGHSGHFGGMARNEGIKVAKNDVICYLDSDDMFNPHHLQSIAEQFSGHWVYWDDFFVVGKNIDNSFILQQRETRFEYGYIGTSCIAHLKKVGNWSTGYGHDWTLIHDHLMPFPGKKITGCGYLVCHMPYGRGDY